MHILQNWILRAIASLEASPGLKIMGVFQLCLQCHDLLPGSGFTPVVSKHVSYGIPPWLVNVGVVCAGYGSMLPSSLPWLNVGRSCEERTLAEGYGLESGREPTLNLQKHKVTSDRRCRSTGTNASPCVHALKATVVSRTHAANVEERKNLGGISFQLAAL